MTCLTSKKFKSCGKSKRGHHDSQQPERFANYKFKRAEVLEEEEEIAPENLITQEDIPDFEARKQMSELVEELVEEDVQFSDDMIVMSSTGDPVDEFIDTTNGVEDIRNVEVDCNDVNKNDIQMNASDTVLALSDVGTKNQESEASLTQLIESEKQHSETSESQAGSQVTPDTSPFFELENLLSSSSDLQVDSEIQLTELPELLQSSNIAPQVLDTITVSDKVGKPGCGSLTSMNNTLKLEKSTENTNTFISCERSQEKIAEDTSKLSLHIPCDELKELTKKIFDTQVEYSDTKETHSCSQPEDALHTLKKDTSIEPSTDLLNKRVHLGDDKISELHNDSTSDGHSCVNSTIGQSSKSNVSSTSNQSLKLTNSSEIIHCEPSTQTTKQNLCDSNYPFKEMSLPSSCTSIKTAKNCDNNYTYGSADIKSSFNRLSSKTEISIESTSSVQSSSSSRHIHYDQSPLTQTNNQDLLYSNDHQILSSSSFSTNRKPDSSYTCGNYSYQTSNTGNQTSQFQSYTSYTDSNLSINQPRFSNASENTYWRKPHQSYSTNHYATMQNSQPQYNLPAYSTNYGHLNSSSNIRMSALTNSSTMRDPRNFGNIHGTNLFSNGIGYTQNQNVQFSHQYQSSNFQTSQWNAYTCWNYQNGNHSNPMPSQITNMTNHVYEPSIQNLPSTSAYAKKTNQALTPVACQTTDLRNIVHKPFVQNFPSATAHVQKENPVKKRNSLEQVTSSQVEIIQRTLDFLLNENKSSDPLTSQEVSLIPSNTQIPSKTLSLLDASSSDPRPYLEPPSPSDPPPCSEPPSPSDPPQNSEPPSPSDPPSPHSLFPKDYSRTAQSSMSTFSKGNLHPYKQERPQLTDKMKTLRIKIKELNKKKAEKGLSETEKKLLVNLTADWNKHKILQATMKSDRNIKPVNKKEFKTPERITFEINNKLEHREDPELKKIGYTCLGLIRESNKDPRLVPKHLRDLRSWNLPKTKVLESGIKIIKIIPLDHLATLEQLKEKDTNVPICKNVLSKETKFDSFDFTETQPLLKNDLPCKQNSPNKNYLANKIKENCLNKNNDAKIISVSQSEDFCETETTSFERNSLDDCLKLSSNIDLNGNDPTALLLPYKDRNLNLESLTDCNASSKCLSKDIKYNEGSLMDCNKEIEIISNLLDYYNSNDNFRKKEDYCPELTSTPDQKCNFSEKSTTDNKNLESSNNCTYEDYKNDNLQSCSEESNNNSNQTSSFSKAIDIQNQCIVFDDLSTVHKDLQEKTLNLDKYETKVVDNPILSNQSFVKDGFGIKGHKSSPFKCDDQYVFKFTSSEDEMFSSCLSYEDSLYAEKNDSNVTNTFSDDLAQEPKLNTSEEELKILRQKALFSLDTKEHHKSERKSFDNELTILNQISCGNIKENTIMNRSTSSYSEVSLQQLSSSPVHKKDISNFKQVLNKKDEENSTEATYSMHKENNKNVHKSEKDLRHILNHKIIDKESALEPLAQKDKSFKTNYKGSFLKSEGIFCSEKEKKHSKDRHKEQTHVVGKSSEDLRSVIDDIILSKKKEFNRQKSSSDLRNQIQNPKIKIKKCENPKWSPISSVSETKRKICIKDKDYVKKNLNRNDFDKFEHKDIFSYQNNFKHISSEDSHNQLKRHILKDTAKCYITISSDEEDSVKSSKAKKLKTSTKVSKYFDYGSKTDEDMYHRDSHKVHCSKFKDEKTTSGAIVPVSAALTNEDKLHKLVSRLRHLRKRGNNWTLQVHYKCIVEISDQRDQYSKDSSEYAELTNALKIINKGRGSSWLNMIGQCICRKSKKTLTTKTAVRCIQQLMPGVQSVVVSGPLQTTEDLDSVEEGEISEDEGDVKVVSIDSIDAFFKSLH